LSARQIRVWCKEVWLVVDSLPSHGDNRGSGENRLVVRHDQGSHGWIPGRRSEEGHLMSKTQSSIPRGLEVLLKKASVDPPFKDLLLGRRAKAAETIGLALEPGEVLMLQSVSTEQLDGIIARTTVPQEHRRAFLGQAAVAMLAALGVEGLASTCQAVDKLVAAQGITPNPLPPLSPLPDKIEEHVKEVIARRFQVKLDQVKPKVSLLDLLKAGVGRPPDLTVPVAGAVARLPDDVHLLGLKRQLEKEYAIKLDGDDFFKKVKTVGELVQAVQAAVNNRSRPGREGPGPSSGVQPKHPVTLGIRPQE
jgi:acyl carrier protein